MEFRVAHLLTDFESTKQSLVLEPEVDFAFDVPVDLIKGIAGFRYDQIHERKDVDSFRILAEAKTPDTCSGFFGKQQ